MALGREARWARLVAATVAGNAVSYSYDAFDVRVSATVNGAANNYLWVRQAADPLLVDDGSTASTQQWSAGAD